MNEELTPRQREIFEYILKTTREKGYPPSVREIGKAVGLSSSSTVHGHLFHLEKKGYIRRDASKPRAIEILAADINEMEGPAGQTPAMVQVPLLGRITAGEPILANENIEETFSLPKHLVGANNVFMLTVVGNSMIEAGIYNGDYVIVKQQNTAENGNIVVALLGDEATVKRFYRERDRIRLQPENSQYAPIFTREVLILGIVIGLYRSFDG